MNEGGARCCKPTARWRGERPQRAPVEPQESGLRRPKDVQGMRRLAQSRATLSDLNGHTARTKAHASHARSATRSGLMPTMFITRVRL